MVARNSSNTVLNQLLNASPLSLPGRVETVRWTFAALTTGAVGAHTLGTVTGLIAIRVVGVVVSDVSGAGTIECGVAGNTAALLAQVAGTALDAGEIWHDATPDAKIENVSVLSTKMITTDTLLLTIATDTLTGGSVDLTILWAPISEDGNFEKATPA